MLSALNLLWPYTGEFFKPNKILPAAVDYTELFETWDKQVGHVIGEATLASDLDSIKSSTNWMQSGGLDGNHTEHLGYLLAEMQFLQRAYPGLTW